MDANLTEKYCRGCSNRLVPPDASGNLNDGAFWRFDFRCLACRLKAEFFTTFAPWGIQIKLHGQYNWTSQQRSRIAVALLESATEMAKTAKKGRMLIIRVLILRARDVLALNADLLDRQIEYYRPWMER